jgi:hypothetical protein
MIVTHRAQAFTSEGSVCLGGVQEKHQSSIEFKSKDGGGWKRPGPFLKLALGGEEFFLVDFFPRSRKSIAPASHEPSSRLSSVLDGQLNRTDDNLAVPHIQHYDQMLLAELYQTR